MPRKIVSFPNHLQLKAIVKSKGRHSIGDNLRLDANGEGSASWIARLTMQGGKRRDIGLGSFPDVPLSEARERVADLRKMVREGLDPVAIKQEQIEAQKTENALPTFAEAVATYYELVKGDYRNPKTPKQWLSSLEIHILPQIGNIKISALTKHDVAKALKPLWNLKHETARRLFSIIIRVSVWASANDFREAALDSKEIRQILGKQVYQVEHRKRVKPADAPTAMASLKAQEDGMSRLCLEFTIRTAARPTEAREAQWSEIDLEKQIWTIPAKRMKQGIAHSIPLTSAAMAILEKLASLRSSEFVFSNPRGRPYSDVAISDIQKVIAPDTTVHGWRGTFRTWAAENGVAKHLAATSLAHKDMDKVDAAYNHTDYLEQRTTLMEAYSSYLDGHTANVADIGLERAKRGAA